ncbi:hypothetical protein Nepgr_006725 [Nepenthes gracilis]|uniref:Uncharacterized protein n=1 Tax=Nepenthes gracilis TaxID=150966 RepID=A0AAD3S5N6_NEPGR|nr:hypothetical protein Nepgr_006725 [Nepenthes gracilis]
MVVSAFGYARMPDWNLSVKWLSFRFCTLSSRFGRNGSPLVHSRWQNKLASINCGMCNHGSRSYRSRFAFFSGFYNEALRMWIKHRDWGGFGPLGAVLGLKAIAAVYRADLF